MVCDYTTEEKNVLPSYLLYFISVSKTPWNLHHFLCRNNPAEINPGIEGEESCTYFESLQIIELESAVCLVN